MTSESRLKQNVVVRAKQEDRRKIGQHEAAVLSLGLSELHLGVAPPSRSCCSALLAPTRVFYRID